MSTTTTKDVIEYREDELAFINPAEDNVSEPINTILQPFFFFVNSFYCFCLPIPRTIGSVQMEAEVNVQMEVVVF